MQKKAEPRALAAPLMPDAVHPIVPIACAEERKAVRARGGAAIDGAETVLEQRGVFARNRWQRIRLVLIRRE